MAPAVLFRRYDALSLVDVLDEALKTFPEARKLLQRRRPNVGGEAARLADLR
jgi:hypothetical protein